MWSEAQHIHSSNGSSASQDLAKVIGWYTDDVKNALIVINSYLWKKEFIVFDTLLKMANFLKLNYKARYSIFQNNSAIIL